MITTKINQVERVTKSASILLNKTNEDGTITESQIGSISANYDTNNPIPVFSCTVRDMTQVDKIEVLKAYNEFIQATLSEIGLPTETI